MSGIVINFPDCAEVSPVETSETITVNAENCGPPGPPPVISWWETLAGLIVVVSVIVGVAVVRYRAHELKPERLEARNKARQIELDAQVKMATQHKRCGTCGDTYEPELMK